MVGPESNSQGRTQLPPIPEEVSPEPKNLEIIWNTDELELHNPSAPVKWSQRTSRNGFIIFAIPKTQFKIKHTPSQTSPRKSFSLSRNKSVDAPEHTPYDPAQAMISGALDRGEPIEIDDHPVLSTGMAMGEEDPLVATQTQLRI
jgi:hypothetical protein